MYRGKLKSIGGAPARAGVKLEKKEGRTEKMNNEIVLNGDFGLKKVIVEKKMGDSEKKTLTKQNMVDTKLYDDEARIIKNLRRYAQMYPHSELAIILKVHDGKLKYGTLCMGIAPHCSAIRL